MTLTPADELRIKHARLMDVMDQTGARALKLNSSGALSWLLAGARNHISLAAPPVFTAVVHYGGVELGIPHNELGRTLAEEIKELLDGPVPVTVHTRVWYHDMHNLDPWLPVTRGWNVVQEEEAQMELRAARASLLEPEIQRYRELCTMAAESLTDVLSEVTPETTEMELAAALSLRIIAAGAEPLVLLAQGESRAHHRHPLPTNTALGRRAMAVVCARKGGLIANVTRWVGFGDPVPGEVEQDLAITQVEADIFAALEVEKPLEPILETIKTSYPKHGFHPDEWLQHHQGGAAGYQGRDPRLQPGVPDLVYANQAFAWNPTGYSEALEIGSKIEDTVLLRADESAEPEIEVLSADDRWPTIEVAGRQRPDILRR